MWVAMIPSRTDSAWSYSSSVPTRFPICIRHRARVMATKMNVSVVRRSVLSGPRPDTHGSCKMERRATLDYERHTHPPASWQTRRPTNQQTNRPTDPENQQTNRPTDPENQQTNRPTDPENQQTSRPEDQQSADPQTTRPADPQTRRSADQQTDRPTDH